MSTVSSPSTARLVAPILLGAVVLGVTATLSGCSAALNALHHVHEESFFDQPEAADGWVGVGVPDWIPADASELHNLATFDETNSVIRVTTDLPPAGECETVPRRALPFETTDWAPELSPLPDTVERCGSYEVVAVEGGLLGWFTATEEGETPE